MVRKELNLLKKRGPSPRSGRRFFTEEDDKYIRDLFAAGKTYDQVCTAFNPPAHRGSIKYRVELMASRGLMPEPKRRM
jgi:hypothetical protein